jgi:hypothetical protein
MLEEIDPWDDERLALQKARNSISGIRDASPRLKNNLDFLLKAVKERPSNFDYAPEEFQNNEILYGTVKKILLSQSIDLRYVPLKFKDDKDVVLKAIKDYYGDFQYVSERLKKDPDVILAVLKSADFSRGSFPSELKKLKIDDPYQFLDVFAEKDILRYFPSLGLEKYLSDKKFMLSAIKLNPILFASADRSLRTDNTFIFDAIRANPKLRHFGPLYIPKEVNQDPRLIKNLGNKITTIKYPRLPIHLTFINITKPDILNFKENLKKVVSLIQNSSVPNFSKALKDNIYIGTKSDLGSSFSTNISETTLAYYDLDIDDLFYVTDSDVSIYNIIHEFAHKFQNTMIKGGMTNRAIFDFFIHKVSRPNLSCKFPKIGDPLSDLREDWWTVRFGSDEFYLKSIGSDNSYTYVSDNGEKKVIPQKKMLELLNCASGYGSVNHLEWFAEMCTLITLNKVKPNQKWVAEELIRIIAENFQG